MKTYPKWSDRKLYGFEIDNLIIGPRTLAKYLSKQPGVSSVRHRQLKIDDLRLEFEFNGETFRVWEEFGDNSKYLVRSKDSDYSMRMAQVEKLFQECGLPLLQKVIFVLCVLLVVGMLFYSTAARADCRGTPEPYVGTFEIVGKSDASIGCRPEESVLCTLKLGDAKCNWNKLRIAGCILELKFIKGSGEPGKILQVYANTEVCAWKENKVAEFYVASECCDVGYGINCSSGKDGFWPYDMSYTAYACMAGTLYYVDQYLTKVNGKSIVREYNYSREFFEDAKDNKFKKYESHSNRFSGGEMLRWSPGGGKKTDLEKSRK